MRAASYWLLYFSPFIKKIDRAQGEASWELLENEVNELKRRAIVIYIKVPQHADRRSLPSLPDSNIKSPLDVGRQLEACVLLETLAALLPLN